MLKQSLGEDIVVAAVASGVFGGFVHCVQPLLAKAITFTQRCVVQVMHMLLLLCVGNQSIIPRVRNGIVW